MLKAYTTEDPPVQPSDQVATAVFALMRQKELPCRSSSSMLATSSQGHSRQDMLCNMPTPQQAATCMSFMKMFQMASMMDGNQFQLMGQPEKFKLTMEPNLFNRPGSSGSLSSSPRQPDPAPILPLPSPQAQQEVVEEDSEKKEDQGKQPAGSAAKPKAAPKSKPTQSLEAYEQAAFKALSDKAPKKAAKQEKAPKPETVPKPIKRPASAMKMTPNANGQSSGKSKRKNCWGCTRCRGCVAGCEKCNFPGFKGKRLNGRAAWLEWKREHDKGK